MLVGLDLLSADGEMEAGVRSPHRGSCLSQLSESEEKHLRLRGKQPKWNENQTALAAVIHTLDGIVAGSWSLGIGEQSQGKGCC